MSDHSAGIPAQLNVPVSGGELTTHHWQFDAGAGITHDPPPVVALHGITANGRAYDAVARALTPAGPASGQAAVGDLYAPDLRGRAGSAALGGPYGLGAHVDDLLALLDHLRAPTAVLLGHSMGAFVAALAAARHPDRFPQVVLVDGGLGFPPPEGADVDAQLAAVLGPAMRRLSMTFTSLEEYRDFFRQHPALEAHWGPDIEAYVDRDLVGEPGALHSSCVVDAVRADGGEVLTHGETLAALHQPQVRGTLLWAERGLLDDPANALYDAERVASAGLDPARLTARRVEGTNHYSILFADDAVATVADEVHRALRRVHA